MNTELIYVKNEIYVFNEVEDRMVVLEPTEEVVYILGRLEKHIIALFDGENTVADIIKILQDEYPNDSVTEDIKEYVNDLIEKGILVEK